MTAQPYYACRVHFIGVCVLNSQAVLDLSQLRNECLLPHP